MSKNPEKQPIQASDEAWDSGELGRDEKYVRVAEQTWDDLIDEALELKPISIRLQKSLIDDLKAIATLHGLGYQPLMRQILKRFADSEKKRIMNDMVCEQIRAEKEERLRNRARGQETSDDPDDEQLNRKHA